MEELVILSGQQIIEDGDEGAAEISRNHPFKGGYITRSHAKELPWVQLEMSRAPFLSNKEKGLRILNALAEWSMTS